MDQSINRILFMLQITYNNIQVGLYIQQNVNTLYKLQIAMEWSLVVVTGQAVVHQDRVEALNSN